MSFSQSQLTAQCRSPHPKTNLMISLLVIPTLFPFHVLSHSTLSTLPISHKPRAHSMSHPKLVASHSSKLRKTSPRSTNTHQYHRRSRLAHTFRRLCTSYTIVCVLSTNVRIFLQLTAQSRSPLSICTHTTQLGVRMSSHRSKNTRPPGGRKPHQATQVGCASSRSSRRYGWRMPEAFYHRISQHLSQG